MENLNSIHRIIQLMSQWRYYTEYCSSALLNDVNHTNEDIVVELLNIVYSWGLVNLNEKKANFPAIDLGDEKKGIGVSVTATKSSTYVNEKIKTFIKHKVYETYPSHYFFITTQKSSYTATFDTENKYAFNKDEHIIDIGDLVTKIKALSPEVQKEIALILERYVGEFKFDFIEDITPQDIAKILTEFSIQTPNLVSNVTDRVKEIKRTEFPVKNEINNLSENYIKLIQQNSLPFFEQFSLFLEKLENRDFKKIYLNVTGDLQKVILTERSKYTEFDKIFDVIEETCKAKIPELVNDRRKLQILLHFMYFQCDIGENKV